MPEVLDTQKYQFRYVRTAAGTLPGRNFILQTEAAITELGNTALDNTEEALENSRQALENSENALNISNSAQADASLALTVAYDARERAVNAADAANAAQKTADQAVSDAAAAQTAADKAQSTADYAQETAESALELAREAKTEAETAQSTADTAESKAEAAQEAADAAQETADSAQSQADTNSDSIAALGNALSETESELRQEIEKEGFYFELDEESTDIDSITDTLVKKYYTQNLTTAPVGTSAPYWFWNFIRDDGLRTVQWLRTTDGTLYSRDGTISAGVFGEGTDTFSGIGVPGAASTVDLSVSYANGEYTAAVSSGEVLSVSYSTGNTFTISVDIPLDSEEDGDITYNGETIGTIKDGNVSNPDEVRISGSHCALSVDGGVVVNQTLSLYLVGEWTDYEAGSVEWSDWATLSGGESKGSVAIQMVAATPNCYRRASLMTPHQTYVTVHADTQVRIGDNGYISTSDVDLQLDDCLSASARAGTDLYVYACAPTSGTEPVFVLSANSTVPDGYDADNSRKIGGFHCLCLAVGTISGHALSGYATGDILPDSVWDLRLKPLLDTEGRFYYPSTRSWHTIYPWSWDGNKLRSVYGGSIITGASAYPMHGELFVEEMAKIQCRMPHRDEFVGYAKGSNEKTNIQGDTATGLAGGNVDSAGRRMISDFGAEDCCGHYWWWTDTQWGVFNSTGSSTTYQYGGANTDLTNYAIAGCSWNRGEESRMGHDSIDGDRSLYGGNYGALGRARVGGRWDDGTGCGSRSVSVDSLSASAAAHSGGRGASESVGVADV